LIYSFPGRYFLFILDLYLHSAYILFQEHVFELETDEKNTVMEANKAIYVVYPDETAGNWRVQAVPVSPESFESRKALPEAWRGLRDEELSRVSGIEGGIFVHASGFIGGKYIFYPLTNLF
jgi:uncharacterized UPF0160 family protein